MKPPVMLLAALLVSAGFAAQINTVQTIAPGVWKKISNIARDVPAALNAHAEKIYRELGGQPFPM